MRTHFISNVPFRHSAFRSGCSRGNTRGQRPRHLHRLMQSYVPYAHQRSAQRLLSMGPRWEQRVYAENMLSM